MRNDMNPDPTPLNSTIAAITGRIRERSARSRAAYLAGIDAAASRGPERGRLSCGNLAHAFAACGEVDKARLAGDATPNLGIVSAYNDMLSAHQPFETYPQAIREHARALGATAQVAGGVPAMCDGVTQGRPGMELSLFSRDVIAQATAIALSHDMFDAAICLGVCDKIVPGLLVGALAFGHLPVVFVPAGPMPSGIPNRQKAEVRERYAAGEATREELLAAESASYHAPGTCTFYGTANSNQSMLEAMGLQLPGASFVNPGTPLREALTRAAVERALRCTALGADHRPIGRLVDERAIVNAIAMLAATGGSTNHTIHWIAVARAAGIVLTWEDIDAIARAVPLLARVYPNGEADVNRFAAAGGLPFVFRELLDAGLVHADIATIVPGGMRAYADEARLDGGSLAYAPSATTSGDDAVLRPVSNAFEAQGGLRLLRGNLGRAIFKLSALKPEHRRIEAPAVVVDNPQALNKLHAAGALPRDFVAVVRFQGPRANGMPEMHSLTPLLGMLQNQGRRVALVTDGRLSGASGKVPAAIHLVPEAARGGALAKLRDGDTIRVDGEAGTLEALVDAAEWESREAAADTTPPADDLGRNLFALNRAQVTPADQGAVSISCGPPGHDRRDAPEYDAEYLLGRDRDALAAPHDAKDA
jgi:phosphogluconate dehydratase